MRGIVGDRLRNASENSQRQHQAGGDRFSLPRRSGQRELAVKPLVATNAAHESSAPWIQDSLQAQDAA